MPDIIDELAGLDAASISKKFGFDKKVADFQASITEAKTLSGEARKKVARSIESALQPSTYIIDDVKYQIERAKKKDDKTGADMVEAACGPCCCD